MATIWSYEDINRRCYIAKSDPVFHNLPVMNMKTGELDIHILQGTEITIPKWDWIQKKDDIVWAKYNGCVYDITDLTGANEKTEKNNIKQEGPA